MPRNSNLIELDVEKLFEEHNINEITEIEKLLDAEIERKRNELRSTVGDRYKDVLAASDAIKSMKTISEKIVSNIENITETCEKLICEQVPAKIPPNYEVDRAKIEERTLVIQIRLAVFLNEQIWRALDDENHLNAAQYYLLAQHIHTGLSLTKKELLNRLPFFQHLKHWLTGLRAKIFEQIIKKLESVEITTQETSSNLNALMLLENKSHNELLHIFITHRKTALKTVINGAYANVRIQVSSMVRCLMTTILLLHDCFMYSGSSKGGSIWKELDEIVGENAPTTISKLKLPITPLVLYIPDIIKQFKPKCKLANSTLPSASETKKLLDEWLGSTKQSVKDGLEKSLKSITNIKGLHLTREESLKVEVPENWSKICQDSHLPDNFNIWYHFFQNLITARAKTIIAKTIVNIVGDIQKNVELTLKTAMKSEKSELDLRWYTWTEDDMDISKTESNHPGLSMKARGYSNNIVQLCEKMDMKYFYLLKDVSQYLYGREFSDDMGVESTSKDFKFKRKYIDKEILENYLRSTCIEKSLEINSYVEGVINTSKDSQWFIAKSILGARFLQATTILCPNFQKCCTINGPGDDWSKICDNFNKTSQLLWTNWVDDIVNVVQKECEGLGSVSPQSTLQDLVKWDEIEIQEQTEENIFKSQIKVPLKPSMSLSSILVKLNRSLNQILPHTLPRPVHLSFVEKNTNTILNHYQYLSEKELNQIQSLQYLFDIKFITILCISRENTQLVGLSQAVCDKFRSKVDPFDLDVFYSYLQENVRRAASQSQMIFGCLLPSASQLSNLVAPGKSKEHEKSPSILALSIPASTSWFPLLPITVPSQKTAAVAAVVKKDKDQSPKPKKPAPKKSQDPASVMRQSAASLFGGLTTDWFS